MSLPRSAPESSPMLCSFSESQSFSSATSITFNPTSEGIAKSQLHSGISVPANLTQPLVAADPKLRRLQQDLLILTSFNDNSSLRWRPSWFAEPTLQSEFWTLQNPPHVVTEELPRRPKGRQVMTRRIGGYGDIIGIYMKNAEDWQRYCSLYGIPHDFLSPDQVKLLRLGLPRDEGGRICEPPTWPLYPEPPTPSQGSYVLDPDTYANLPRRFRSIAGLMQGRVITVHPDGKLKIEDLLRSNEVKYVGRGRRWSYIPWTEEQDKSCQPRKLKLVFWDSVIGQEMVWNRS